jgi:hypothetical protein
MNKMDWVMVPAEPTDEMIEAGIMALNTPCGFVVMQKRLRAAIAAAPTPHSAPVQQTARRSMQEAFESSEYYFRGESPARRAENWLIWKDAWQAALAQSPSVGLNTKNGG